jgi:hypothetical protein
MTEAVKKVFDIDEIDRGGKVQYGIYRNFFSFYIQICMIEQFS